MSPPSGHPCHCGCCVAWLSGACACLAFTHRRIASPDPVAFPPHLALSGHLPSINQINQIDQATNMHPRAFLEFIVRPQSARAGTRSS